MIWELHPAYDRYQEDVFREYFREALESGGALVAVDRKSNRVIGSSRYVWHGPDRDELEIGWTFLARPYWGGAFNREMKRLMLDHAFQFVDRVIFLVASSNARSRKAMEKVGGILTDRVETRQIHGVSVDHVVYEMCREHLSPTERRSS